LAALIRYFTTIDQLKTYSVGKRICQENPENTKERNRACGKTQKTMSKDYLHLEQKRKSSIQNEGFLRMPGKTDMELYPS
jgi:hypothetical protein